MQQKPCTGDLVITHDLPEADSLTPEQARDYYALLLPLYAAAKRLCAAQSAFIDTLTADNLRLVEQLKGRVK